jgi:hypothetical protein
MKKKLKKNKKPQELGFREVLIGDRIECPHCKAEGKSSDDSNEPEDARTTIDSLCHKDTKSGKTIIDIPKGTRVLIYKVSLPTFWYVDKIGQMLTINTHIESEYFYLTQEYQCEHTTGYIFKGDCFPILPERFYKDAKGKEEWENLKGLQESLLEEK